MDSGASLGKTDARRIEVLVPPMPLPRERGCSIEWPLGITPHVDLVTFFEYWRSLVGLDGRLPSRADVSPDKLRPLLPGIIIIDVLPQSDVETPYRFRYRLIGTEHRSYLGADLTGRTFDEAFSAERLRMANESCFWIVRERRANYLRMSTRGLATSERVAFYERIMAPLAADGSSVNMLIGMWHFLPLEAVRDTLG